MKKTSFFCTIFCWLSIFCLITPLAFAQEVGEVAGIKIERPKESSLMIPNDPGYEHQWYLPKIGAPEAWRIKTSAAQVVVAVIDTGVYVDNPDLRHNIWVNSQEVPGNKIDDDHNGYVDDINGWDFVNKVPDPNPKFQTGFIDDEINHGTLVAGIIAAEGNNNFGVAGIAWQAKIMPLKALNDQGEGEISDVVKAIDYAVKNGADIINLSFIILTDERELREAIKRANKAGIAVVAPAGNESQNSASHSLDDKKLYPACYGGPEHNVIGVAGTDTLDQKTLFSNYGFSCVDIAAPGVSFMSLTVVNPYKLYKNRLFDQYYQGYWDGTSMSTAVVSGSLALLKSINPEIKRAELINFLLNTADNIGALNPKYPDQLGHGRINLASAASAVYEDLMSYRNLVIVAPQNNVNNNIRVFNSESNTASVFFKPFEGNLGGGISVSAGDTNGDGLEEIVASAGTQVKIFDSSGKLKNQFSIYQKNWRGYLNAAAGDTNGDGTAEIIVGLSKNNEPKIRIFNDHGILQSQFFAYDKKFRGGVSVAAGDVDGDGRDEIITGAGPGGGPHVRIFDQTGKVIGQFFAYDKKFRGGVNVAAADINFDGRDEIITGAGPGGGPHVRIFSKTGVVLDEFFGYDQNFRNGVNISAIKVKIKK